MTPTCLRCGEQAEEIAREPGKYWQFCTFDHREEHLAKLDRELATATRQAARWTETAQRVRTARRAASRPIDVNEAPTDD